VKYTSLPRLVGCDVLVSLLRLMECEVLVSLHRLMGVKCRVSHRLMRCEVLVSLPRLSIVCWDVSQIYFRRLLLSLLSYALTSALSGSCTLSTCRGQCT
jgi:hypothetical protein